MPLSDMIENPQQRLVAHEGLIVDVNTWSSAHDYHITHQQRHNMALHSPGIVMGLEITPFSPADNSIVLNPGAAIDPEGHLIIVSQQQRFVLRLAEPGTLYLILQYREVPSADSGTNGDSHNAEPQYILEAYRVEERRDLPTEPYVELARIQVSGTATPITQAIDPFSPRPDEIDMRFRSLAGTRPIEKVRVGIIPLEVTPEGQITHAPGVMSLIRAINTTTPYHGEFVGSINLSQEITNCDLLVMAGQQSFTLAPEWMLVLKNFVDEGGVLFGESTGNATDDDSPFRQSFMQLAETLGANLQPVERDHNLLRMHHLFAVPPSGLDNSSLVVAGRGLIYSDANYGSLWDGGPANSPAMRETIRSATEFGINLCLYASASLKRGPLPQQPEPEDTVTDEESQLQDTLTDDEPPQENATSDDSTS